MPTTFEDYRGVPSSGRKLAWVFGVAALLFLALPFRWPDSSLHAIQAARMLVYGALALYGIAKVPESLERGLSFLGNRGAAAAPAADSSSDSEAK